MECKYSYSSLQLCLLVLWYIYMLCYIFMLCSIFINKRLVSFPVIKRAIRINGIDMGINDFSCVMCL